MKVFSQLLVFFVVFFLLSAAPVFAVELINLNTATAEELTSLPGIGPATAAKIVEYREAKPFATVEEVMEVKGIGPAKYEAIKSLVSVGEVKGTQAEEKKE